MPHSFGYRARTRHLFSRAFRTHGANNLTNYLTTYKVGDYVDIVANGSIHKGMPHKFYHGKTGVVWNVTRRAIGVEVNKVVRTRVLRKRINVRVEHVKPSRCREDFLKRCAEYNTKAQAAKAAGKPVENKRPVALPRPAHLVEASKSTIELVTPLKYEMLF
eukprot:TRINITY_DN1080_c3_g1_i1.p1 TRINITY_DN1080_c3_g1~~TRINITY_DN1080_c3_g1_i1.p1  ORF type:complete len:161 (-),score=41.82 TRINITY_DN1080_c3_g1_i1:60-542(-)